MKNTIKSTQKIEERFARIQAQLLARQELLAASGRVEESWRTYRQRRLGPYFRLAFRENNCRKSIYLGRCPALAEQVRRFLADLQRPARERRYLRDLRRKTRAALRLETKTLATYLAPLGFHVKGGLIRRRRDQKVEWVKQSADPPDSSDRQEKEYTSPIHSLASTEKSAPAPRIDLAEEIRRRPRRNAFTFATAMVKIRLAHHPYPTWICKFSAIAGNRPGL